MQVTTKKISLPSGPNKHLNKSLCTQQVKNEKNTIEKIAITQRISEMSSENNFQCFMILEKIICVLQIYATC